MSYTELENNYNKIQKFYLGEDYQLRDDIDDNDLDSDTSVASSTCTKQVIVGVCAMAKKSQSKPMKEILTRLQEFEFIKIVIFDEDVILKEPVELWPICDCLISFHSKGFPLDKAIQYAKLRNPYVINNLPMQYDIQDRRKVYATLEREGIEIPRYAVLDRDSPDPKLHELVESEDHVEVNGVTFNKPFVEKPVSAEDHNIYIYYPTSAGGGSQRLFRKIGSRSSVYSPESRVRKTGSFIYEDFMPTDGTDVKVYTVGPDYAHAEARKSPALDGKVERDSEGKEIRYPVILSNTEKLISRKVCLAFKQTVCGFDLLRANGKSFVCDVNGFSFVKNSNKYYDDTSKILGNMILRELANTLHIPWSIPFQLDDPPIVPTTFGKMMELRCVVAVIRHGDRTPKQKMKVEVRHPKFFEIFEKYDGYKHGHIKLKRPKQLQEILDIARFLLAEIQTKNADPEIEEKQGKLEQLKQVLEMYGHFSGINRKVQMKYQPKGRPRGSSSDDDSPSGPSLVLILKWGGELTPAGRIQAEELGRIFRCMYPGGGERCNGDPGTQGLGLLRLHSTFRHDLKIYASDEGRVQMTAAAFAKGLLALEGELTPILVQMVKSANTNGLLDNDCDSSKYQNMVKSRLHELMQNDRDFTDADRDAINPGHATSISQAIDFVKNPVKCCQHVQQLIQQLMAIVNVKKDDPKTRDAILYHGETWELMIRRWGKIEKDFCQKNKTFDISKIPDIYDCIKYDLQHNQHTLQFEQAEELYIYSKNLADIIIPQEYGITVQEKLTIGTGICTPLLKKIRADLQRNIEEQDGSVNRLNPHYSHGVSSPGRHVRTRLYFTSESHVHSLLTVLRYGGLLNTLSDEQWRRAMEYVSMVSELNYMSQIVVMLYEDPTKDPCSEERFHVELHFSPGVNCCVQKNLPPGPGFRPHSRNDSVTSRNTSGDEENSANRIDEENDDELGNMKYDDYDENRNMNSRLKKRNLRSSDPIPIGQCHTVSGHEAMDLAKRLSEELAAQQHSNQTGSLKSNRAASPDSEPRSRSFEQRGHKSKAMVPCQSLQAVNNQDNVKESSTNELPLTALNFSPLSPEIRINECEPASLNLYKRRMSQSYDSLLNATSSFKISPLATNERPLSCDCLDDPFLDLKKGNSNNPLISLSLDSFDKFLIDDLVNNNNNNNRTVCENINTYHSQMMIPVMAESSSSRVSKPIAIEYLLPNIQNSNSNEKRRTLMRKCKSTDDDAMHDGTIATQKLFLSHNPIIKLTKKSYLNNKNSESATGTHSNIRRHRHSLGGNQMSSCFKMLTGNCGGVGKNNKMTTSTNSLFSTAVISGSSSAPNLRDMIPNTASPSVLEGFGGVPPIRPLETLHNALSLKMLDVFLEHVTSPVSPPKYPSTPLQTTPPNYLNQSTSPLIISNNWSGQSSNYSSMANSIAFSTEEPSSPTISECSASVHEPQSAVFGLSEVNIRKMLYDQSLNSFQNQRSSECFVNSNANESLGPQNLNKSEDITPASSEIEFCTTDATKGSTINEIGSDDEEATIAVTPTALLDCSEQELLTSQLDNWDLNQPSIESNDSTQAIASTSKIDNKMHSKIQKQISLFEKDVSTQNKNLSQEGDKYVEMPFNIKQDQNIQSNLIDCDKFYSQPPRFISAEDLEKYTPNFEKNLLNSNKVGSIEKCPKTKGCVELITTSGTLNNHSPGAMLIREGFIEPPKVNYINRQNESTFDDRNLNITNYQASTSASMVPLPSASASEKRNNSRFTTTFVNEDSKELPLKSLRKQNDKK